MSNIITDDPRVKDLKITFNYNNLGINELSITCTQEGYTEEEAFYNPIVNYIEQLKVDCFVHDSYPTIEHNNGLMIFMHKIYISTTTTDLKYQTGTNTFAFLQQTDYYNVQPRPEACSTLFTTHNICTTGNIIGQNIESHVFALNSLGNDVDRAVIRLQQLKTELEQMYAQLEAQISSLTEQIELTRLGSMIGGVFNVLPAITTFAANALNMETAAITAANATFENLVVDELELEDIVSTTINATTAELENITATGTATFENLVVSGEMELEDIVSTTINATSAEIEDITATGTITANTLIVNSETGGTIASISAPTINVSEWIQAGEMELEDITATGTATFARAIADEMELTDLTVQRAAFDAFYLGSANNANDLLETQPSDSDLKATGKLVNDIDLSGFSGEYSDNHIMSSKAINELIAKNNESHNLTLNESLTNTLANYVKTESLTTTLNDYGTKEWVNNISVSQHRVINENNTALYPIVKSLLVSIKNRNLP